MQTWHHLYHPVNTQASISIPDIHGFVDKLDSVLNVYCKNKHKHDNVFCTILWCCTLSWTTLSKHIARFHTCV